MMSRLWCVFRSAFQGEGFFVTNTFVASSLRAVLSLASRMSSGDLRLGIQRASLSIASLFGGGIITLYGARFFARKGYPDLWHLSYCYEPEVTTLIMDRVARGGVFVDVGAHVGRYTVLSAIHGADQVLSVEANPITFEALRRNISLNGLEERVLAFNVAAGESETQVGLSINPENDGGSSIVSGHGNNVVRVPMRPLDKLLSECEIAPSQVVLVKIDVEGAEPLVMRGARSILEQGAPILFEALDEHALRDVLAVIRPYGYRVRRVAGANYLAER